MSRLVNIGRISDEDAAMAEISKRAFASTLKALTPGAKAKEVYTGWKSTVDEAGMTQYRRHHCGYLVGIGFPPSWTGGPRVSGLSHDSDLEMKVGMKFHLMSWCIETIKVNFFNLNMVLLGKNGAEVLNKIPYGPPIK